MSTVNRKYHKFLEKYNFPCLRILNYGRCRTEGLCQSEREKEREKERERERERQTYIKRERQSLRQISSERLQVRNVEMYCLYYILPRKNPGKLSKQNKLI